MERSDILISLPVYQHLFATFDLAVVQLQYYWHDPKTGELYVALLADFIIEFIDNSEPGNIVEDYS